MIGICSSSPHAKRGIVYSAFRKHWGQDESDVLVFRGTSADLNPQLPEKVIAKALEADPAKAAAEYLAQFRDDIAQFVAREVVDACIVEPGRFEIPPMSGTRYRAWTDPSGGSADSMTLALGHTEGAVQVLDCVREVRPPFSPESVVKEFAATLKSYRVTRVTGDRYAGEWPRERFREHGIQYDVADRPCSDLYRDLLPLLNSAKVELLDLPRLTAQLCSLERRTSRSSRDSISHPPGGHDDIAAAVAGVLTAQGTNRWSSATQRLNGCGRCRGGPPQLHSIPDLASTRDKEPFNDLVT